MSWALAPSYGAHCGPGHQSEGPPINDTDEVCKRHDRCYETSFGRAEELECDLQACHDVRNVVADGFVEAVYKKGMEKVFCDQEICLEGEQRNQSLAPREWGRPRRNPKVRFDEVLKEEIVVLEQREPRQRRKNNQTPVPEGQHDHAGGKGGPPALPARNTKGYRAAKRKLNRVRRANRAKNPRKQGRKKLGYKRTVKKRLKRAGVRPTVGVSEFAHKIERDWNITPLRGKGRKSDGIILEGSDLLDVVSSGGTLIPVGTTTYTIPLAPSDTAWGTTRLAQFVPLFQRFKFQEVEFIWEPACGTATGGQGIHFVDYDVDVSEAITPIAGTLNSVKVAAAKKRNKPFRFWEENRTRYIPDGEIQTLFLTPGVSGSDPRLYSQGRYFLIVASPPPTGTSLGILYVRYKIHLWDASLTIAAPTPPPAQDAFVWQYNFEATGPGPILSSDSAGSWILDSPGNFVGTFSNMPAGFQAEAAPADDLPMNLLLHNLPLGTVDIHFGVKFWASVSHVDKFSGGTDAQAYFAMDKTAMALSDWVRLDVADDAWRDGFFDWAGEAATVTRRSLTTGVGETALVTCEGRAKFSHNAGNLLQVDMFDPMGISSVDEEYDYCTWINVIVIPPSAKHVCPHEIRARPLGAGFRSDLYIWNEASACQTDCPYCEKQRMLSVSDKERRHIAKEKRKDTLEDVLAYLLKKSEAADAKESETRKVLKDHREEHQVKRGSLNQLLPDDQVIQGIMKLPGQLRPRALLILAHCPCECGQFSCDTCGCRELGGTEVGMPIPYPEISTFPELQKFWNTTLAQVTTETALRDLAQRQGTLRSLRAYLMGLYEGAKEKSSN